MTLCEAFVVGVMVVAPVVVVSFVVVVVPVNVLNVIHRSRCHLHVVVVVESTVSMPVKALVIASQFELLRHERGSSEWRWKRC